MPAAENTVETEQKPLGIDRSEPSGWASNPNAPSNPSDPSNPEGQPNPSPEEDAEPAGAQKNLDRPSAEDIYQQVARNAQAELKRSSLSLAVSGFTGGTFMGFSALGVGLILAALGHTPTTFVLSRMFYPLGFIVVIIGRSQLFTENTLYPVALVLAERKELWNTLRLWAIVLPSNVLGALAFAALISLTHAGSPALVQAIAGLGVESSHKALSVIFWTGVMGGWIIATAAWLVSSSHSITGSVIIIWVLTFLVGLGNFAHCIASSGELFTAVLTHQLPWLDYPRWLSAAVAGNICGGVLMVTLLEYGQAMFGRNLKEETENAIKSAS